MSALTAPTSPTPFPPAGPTEPSYRLSVDQYHRMISAGIIEEGEPIELIEGRLIQKMPKNPPHEAVLRAVIRSFPRLIPAGWMLQIQMAITLHEGEPEPDVSVVRDRRYTDRHPGPEDIALIIEVAQSSLAIDRGLKLRSYARSGIPIYWIVNVESRQIEIYSDPDQSAGTYRSAQFVNAAGSLPLTIAGQNVASIPSIDLLP